MAKKSTRKVAKQQRQRQQRSARAQARKQSETSQAEENAGASDEELQVIQTVANQAGKISLEGPEKLPPLQLPPVSFSPTPSGLPNLGNTCYFNSVCQVLGQTYVLHHMLTERSVPGFIWTAKTFYLEEKSPSGDGFKSDSRQVQLPVVHPLISTFLKLQQEIFGQKRTSPHALLGEIRKERSQFEGWSQQDSQELLISLIDSMKKVEAERQMKVLPKALGIDIKNPTDEDKVKAQRFKITAKHTVLDAIFAGQLLSCIRCTECNYRSFTFENFMDLSLSLNLHPNNGPAASESMSNLKKYNNTASTSTASSKSTVTNQKGKKGATKKGRQADNSSDNENDDDEDVMAIDLFPATIVEEDNDDNRSMTVKERKQKRAQKKAARREAKKTAKEMSAKNEDKSSQETGLLDGEDDDDNEEDEADEEDKEEEAEEETESAKDRTFDLSAFDYMVSREPVEESKPTVIALPWKMDDDSPNEPEVIPEVLKVKPTAPQESNDTVKSEETAMELIEIKPTATTPTSESTDSKGDSGEEEQEDEPTKSELPGAAAPSSTMPLVKFEDCDSGCENDEDFEDTDGTSSTSTVLFGPHLPTTMASSSTEGRPLPSPTSTTIFFGPPRPPAFDWTQDPNLTDTNPITTTTTKPTPEDSEGARADSEWSALIEPATTASSGVNSDDGGATSDSTSSSAPPDSPSGMLPHLPAEYRSKFYDIALQKLGYGGDWDNRDLGTLFESFIKPEILDGPNKYLCESCCKANGGKKTYSKAIRCQMIALPPPVLVVHLKRFEASLTFGGRRGLASMHKLNTRITFPERLNLSPYTSKLYESFAQFYEPDYDQEAEESKLEYQLYGAVIHSGGLRSGHYMAYVAVRPEQFHEPERLRRFLHLKPFVSNIEHIISVCYEQEMQTGAGASGGGGAKKEEPQEKAAKAPGASGSSERKWYFISDSSVSASSLSQVLSDTTSPYLLFYERVH